MLLRRRVPINNLPSYIQKADSLKSKSVDTIFCLSVNDPFVMQAWAKAHNVKNEVTLLADGSAALTKALGMILDLDGIGLGLRSHRYVMVIDQGVVTHLNIEKNPGECALSGAHSIEAVL